MVSKCKIKVSPNQKIITQIDEYGWETKFQYRKSMNDFTVSQKNKESIKRDGSNGCNDRFCYIHGDIVKEIIKLIRSDAFTNCVEKEQ